MKWRVRVPGRRWLVVPPILVGLAVVVLLVLRRESPPRRPVAEMVRTVRVIEVQPLDVIPRALGYGTVQPAEVWQAVAEVRGRVVEVHPDLQAGALIPAGELLLRLDPAEYELQLAQFQADLARVEAQMEELEVQESNDRASLEIEEASLLLAEAERERLESLVDRQAISAAEVDLQRRTVLTQRQQVQRLQNSLQLIPQKQQSLVAEQAVKQAGRAQAELDLVKTEITAPFDCRLGDVDLRPGQFLSAGQLLFTAHGTSAMEVEAQLPLDQLRTLIATVEGQAPPMLWDPETVPAFFDFQAVVRYHSGDFRVEWDARVVRLRERLDPRTRTAGLVVAVDRPYELVIPGQRPPLKQGMYCQVELRGATRADRIVIPRAALHDGHVYLVGEDRRMVRRAVQVEFVQADFVCLAGGLRAGDVVVVSDPQPAIEGLRLEPVPDDDLPQRLAAQASGTGAW